MKPTPSFNAKTKRPGGQRGMTILELAVVLLILVAMAGVTLPYIGGTSHAAACQTTDASLAAVRDAIMGAGVTPGYLSDMGDLPYFNDANGARRDSLHFLFASQIQVVEGAATNTYNANNVPAGNLTFNPATRRGWRGPYLSTGVVADANLVARLDGSFTSLARLNMPIAAGQSLALDNYHPASCAAGDCRNPVAIQFPCTDGNGDGQCGNAADTAQPLFVRLISAGPNGVLDTPITDPGAAAANRLDDRVLFLRTADPVGNQPCE